MPPPPLGDSTNTRQLLVERVRQATNILVAVSANPSIDSLAAALALTLMLNKFDKHATAVFSGQLPPVMQFLSPEKTFETNTDSLRDFIISLDKEKADRLRYKLEKDVVRIFITPYRTTISEKDLQFSQGDFNVDLIIALGVERREELDRAIVAHGRILHDATVVTINSNGQQSTLGAVDWHDPNSSSLCEMLVSMAEALQKPGLLDAQIANALLTGIVAATERFSNQHTTPRVMTMSAQLMAAGANQQLVATNIQEAHQPLPEMKDAPEKMAESTASPDGALAIKHDPKKETPKDKEPKPVDAPLDAEKELEAALPNGGAAQPDTKELEDLTKQLEQEAKKSTAPPPSRGFMAEPPEAEAEDEPTISADESKAPVDKAGKEAGDSSWRERRIEPLAPPSLGGSLSATSEEALEDTLRSEETDRNHKLLSHNGGDSAINESEVLTHQTPNVSPLPAGVETPPTLTPASDSGPTPEPSTIEPVVTPLEPGDNGVGNALEAVDAALASQPFDPSGRPAHNIGSHDFSDGSEVHPYIPLDSTASPQSSTPVAPESAPQQPTTLPLDASGLPIIPPMPSLPTQEPGMQGPPMPPPLPPLPGDTGASAVPSIEPSQPQSDPGQFKIPGQS